MNTEFNNISFNMPPVDQVNSIKVIGVGGGGSNAVDHMYAKQIKGVDFVICNTDSQALVNSPIPNKIQLGASLTSGLGAGANPKIGAQAAAESIQEIQQMLGNHTKMVFITAGMGGGTGTGAAPIIAKIAKDMDILTVGIVTMPFQFEGKMRLSQAQKGIDELRGNVDSLIVINNNKLREVYGNLGFKSGFSKADEVLSTAAKGIAEVITEHYKQNIDLHDAKTVLSNSGTAIMGSAKESGENRAKNAIVKALDSPLLNDNKITGAKNVLLLIVSGANEATLDEIGEINDYIQTEAGHEANIIMGVGEDESMEEDIAVTIVATGFATDQQGSITNTEPKKVVHILGEEQEAVFSFEDKKITKSTTLEETISSKPEKKVTHLLNLEEEHRSKTIIKDTVDNIEEADDKKKIETENISEDEFIINDVIKEEKVEEKPKEIQQKLVFEFPINSNKKPIAEKENEQKKEEVKKTEVVDKTENSIVNKRFLLDDFDVAPTIGKSSQPLMKKEEEEDEDLQFTVRTKTPEEIKKEEKEWEEATPLNITFTELQERTKDRRSKMKNFNYKFSDNVNKSLEEIRKIPAYKRHGIDVGVDNGISKKETPLKGKEDDVSSLYRNSFLHDNVD